MHILYECVCFGVCLRERTAFVTVQGHDITISPVVHGVMGAFISCIMGVSSTGHGKNNMFYLMALPPLCSRKLILASSTN